MCEDGAAALSAAISGSGDGFEALCQQRLPGGLTSQEKAARVVELLDTVRAAASSLMQEAMLQTLAGASGFPIGILRKEVGRTVQGHGGQSNASATTPAGAPAKQSRNENCVPPSHGGQSNASATMPGGAPALANHVCEWDEEKGKNGAMRYQALSISEIWAQIESDHAGEFGRLGGNLFVARPQPDSLGAAVRFLDGPPSVFSWLKSVYPEVRWSPPGRADDQGRSFVTEAEMASKIRAEAPAYRAITYHPLYPERSDVYQRWQAPEGYAPEGERLAEFLDFFKPATDRDRDLLEAFALTLFWGGRPGGRPLFVITPAQNVKEGQSIGKSELARRFADLVGGAMEMELVRRGSFGDSLQKQALEECNLAYRVGLFDDVDGTVRDQRMNDLITCHKIAGRASYSKQAERLNLVTWMMTANNIFLSADLASRSVIIRLNPCDREGWPTWAEEVQAFLDAHGKEVAADCIARLRLGQQHSISTRHSRFPAWDEAVLSRLPTCDLVLDHIRAQSHLMNVDRQEIELLLGEIYDQFKDSEHMGFDRKLEVKSTRLAEIYNEAFGEQRDAAWVVKNVIMKASSREELPCLTKKGARHGAPWIWDENEYLVWIGERQSEKVEQRVLADGGNSLPDVDVREVDWDAAGEV